MLDFLNDSEYWKALLSPQAQANLTEKLIIVAVVWKAMGGKVSKRISTAIELAKGEILGMFQGHLQSIESKFDKAIEEMQSFRQAVTKDLQVNSQRLAKVEDDMQNLNGRLQNVETKLKE